jgi:hypothetical protein
MKDKAYYDHVADVLAQQVANLNKTDKKLYSYRLTSARIALLLLSDAELAQVETGTLHFKDIGWYVITGATRTEGYNPETHPTEIDYTAGTDKGGDPIIIGTYSEEAMLSTAPGYVYQYLTEGKLPPLPKSMIQ